MDERRGQVQPAAHAARVGARQLGGHVVQADQLEELVGASTELIPRHAMQPTDQLQVLATRQQVLDGDLLHREADPPPDGAGLRGDIETEHARPTGGRPKQGGQDADGRRLAGAVGPQEGEELATFDGHVDAVERPGAAGIDLDQRLDLDGRSRWADGARRLHQNGFTTISQMMTSRPAMPRTAPMVGRDDGEQCLEHLVRGGLRDDPLLGVARAGDAQRLADLEVRRASSARTSRRRPRRARRAPPTARVARWSTSHRRCRPTMPASSRIEEGDVQEADRVAGELQQRRQLDPVALAADLEEDAHRDAMGGDEGESRRDVGEDEPRLVGRQVHDPSYAIGPASAPARWAAARSARTMRQASRPMMMPTSRIRKPLTGCSAATVG